MPKRLRDPGQQDFRGPLWVPRRIQSPPPVAVAATVRNAATAPERGYWLRRTDFGAETNDCDSEEESSLWPKVDNTLKEDVECIANEGPWTKLDNAGEGDIDEGDYWCPVGETLTEMRANLNIVVEPGPGDSCPLISSFKEIAALPPYIHAALDDMGIQRPMPIQAQALPILLDGHDLIGIARTGSGKTLAFLLPAIVHIEASTPLPKLFGKLTPLALIFCPTRELAVQIAAEAKKLLQNSKTGNRLKGISASCVYGGKKRDAQLWELSSWGCDVIAATPGRLQDYVTNGEMSLERVSYLVLDEADRMLDQTGFHSEVEDMSGQVASKRQVCFFSATWPEEVQHLANGLCKSSHDPVRILVGQREDGKAASRQDIIQEVIVFDDSEDWEERDVQKQKTLYMHLRKVLQNKESKILVFVSRKALATDLSFALSKDGFQSDCMHGGRSMNERINVLTRFKNNRIRLLIATDVMGRGIDIPEITHVVIYDMGTIDDYVHRIGRTARGLTTVKGHALTLFEYHPKWPELAGELVKVLEESSQNVPDQLKDIACRAQKKNKWNKGGYGHMF